MIAGDTNHHEIIGDSTADALLNLSIERKVPVINGILVVNNRTQAEARAGEEINRGKEFAQAALEMAAFTKKWKTKKTSKARLNAARTACVRCSFSTSGS